MPDGPTRQMWLALTRNNIDELRSALLAGADPNDPDKNGLAPVMVAAMLRNVEMVRLLSTHGAAYPSKAKGQWFNAYFDTLTPWYNSDALWSAEQVAVHWEDFELLEVVLALPGTLAALAPQGTIYPTGSYACAAFERFENVGCSRFLEEVIRAVAVE